MGTTVSNLFPNSSIIVFFKNAKFYRFYLSYYVSVHATKQPQTQKISDKTKPECVPGVHLMNSNQYRYPVCRINLELFQNKVLTSHMIMDIKSLVPTFLLYISCFAFTPHSY